MADTPEVGFSFGVEGDQALLSTIQRLRQELKTLQAQQEEVSSSAVNLAGAWRSLVAVAATLKLAEFGRAAFDSVIAVGRLSAATGISTQTLSVFRKATEDVGLEQEQADKAVLKLSQSIFKLGQGNKQVAATFAQLKDESGKSLTADSFKGLTDDQKFLRVVDALGRLKGSMEGAGAVTQLLGRGQGQLLAVMQKLAGEGFGELQQQTRALGLEVTPQMVSEFLRAEESLQNLKGAATGAALQFETGLVPQLSLAADGIVNVAARTDDGASGFEYIGDKAGKFIKITIAGFTELAIWAKAFGLILLEAIGGAFETIGIVANTAVEATFQTLTFHFSKAWQAIKAGGHDAASAVGDTWNDAKARIDAALESEGKLLAGINAQRPHSKTPGRRNLDGPPDTTETSLARERLSILKQQGEDELALDRILAQGREAVDKEAYDRGLLSLTEYFDRRRDQIRQAAAQENDVLRAERAAIVQELVAVESRKALTPKDNAAKQREVLAIKQQIAHIDAQIAESAAKADNQVTANEDQRFKATQSHKLKELEMQKQLAELEGNRQKISEADARIRELRLTDELRQLGQTQAQIDEALARFRAAEATRSTGAAAQQGFEGGAAAIARRKDELAEQVAAGTLLPYQAAQLLRAELVRQIPLLEHQVELLRQQAEAITAAAKARGETGPNATADQFSKQADEDAAKIAKLRTEVAQMDTTWSQWHKEAFSAIDEVSTHLTTGLNGWIQGHQRFGQALAQTWNSIVMTAVTSLEKIAAQWIAQHLRMLLIKQTTNAAGVASDAAAGAQKEATDRATGIRAVLMQAKQAAAKAFNWASGWGGPIAGAIAAGITFPAVMAFAAFAKGGAVNARSAAPRFVGFSNGGSIVARSMLGGGMVSGPGTGTSDSVPILASNGEHVMTAAATRAIGPDVLDALNRNPGGLAGLLQSAVFPAVRQSAPYSADGFRRYAAGGSVDASRGGDVHFNLPTHIAELNALDGASVRAALEEHGDLIGQIAVSHVKRHFRSNGVNR